MEFNEFIGLGGESFDIEKTLTFEINHNEGDFKYNYIKVDVKPNDENNVFTYFSSLSSERKDAQLLSYEYYDSNIENSVILYINKKLTVQGTSSKFYFSITCFSVENCNVILTVTETDYMDLGRYSEHSFLTQEKTTTNLITINRANPGRGEKEGFLSIWATGHKDIFMKVYYLKNGEKQEKEIISIPHYNGKIINIKEDINLFPIESNDECFFLIEVQAPPLTLVSVGSTDSYKSNKNDLEVDPILFSINSKERHGLLTAVDNTHCYEVNLENIAIDEVVKMNVIDFQKTIDVSFLNKTFHELEKNIIHDGMETFLLYRDIKYICFKAKSPPAEYTFQIIDDKNMTNFPIYNSPQVKGILYTRILSSGKSELYISLPTEDFETEYRIKINSLFGFPKLYLSKCKTFPDCTFNPEDSENIAPHNINGVYSFSFYKKELHKSFIDSEQYVLFADCPRNEKLNVTLDCTFETNFFTEKDILYLRNDKKYYHTIMKGGENLFAINTNNDNNFTQIFVDFYTFTGDISIEFRTEGYEIRNYVAANKEYYVIDNNSPEQKSDFIYFTVSGVLDSHYVVNFKFISNEEDKTNMKGESGISYLETIERKEGIAVKEVHINNRRLADLKPFIINFWSLNCDIIVIRKDEDGTLKPLEYHGHLSQDVVSYEKDEGRYYQSFYSYTIGVLKMDTVSPNENNWCMVYVSSIEENDPQIQNLYKNNKNKDFYDKTMKLEFNNILYKQRQLLISEGQNNQIILNQEVPEIQYIYPHMNPKGWVNIFVTSEQETKFEMKIILNNKLFDSITVGQNRYFTIKEEELRSQDYCPFDEKRPAQPCNVVIQLILDPNFYSDNALISLKINSRENIPSYIRKSMLSQEVIVSDFHQYFYSDVGINEQGHITINFDRGVGHAFARIVRKDVKEEGGWMNRYKLPDKDFSPLKFNHFTKSIKYTKKDTSNCIYGCYLLILVEHALTDEGFLSDYVSLPYSIYIHAGEAKEESSKNTTTIIDIPLNEFILGDTSPSTTTYLDDYFSFYIPYEAEEIIFEVESDGCGLLVNVENEIGNIPDSDPKNAHFSFMNMGNNIYTITKEQIQKIYNQTKIEGIGLLIGVKALHNLNIESSIYSFRIRMRRKEEIENDLNLIHLKSTQKSLCEIKGKKGNCYFLLPIDGKVSLLNDFLFYAMELPGVHYAYYANTIKSTLILERKYKEIKESLPNSNNYIWSSKEMAHFGNYLYIDLSKLPELNNSTYFIINLEVDNPDAKDDSIITIRFLHTFHALSSDVIPNPSTPQLFNVKDYGLNLTFLTEEANYLITLTCVTGKGEIRWNKEQGEDKTYRLIYPSDRLVLSTGWDEPLPLTISSLIHSDLNETGFGFYIYYDKISVIENFFEIKYGNLVTMDQISDFPFIFYCKIPDTDHNIDVNIKILDLKQDFAKMKKIKNDEEDHKKIKDGYFIVQGMVVSEETILNQKDFPGQGPEEDKYMKGNHDGSLSMLTLHFTSEKIKSYKINGVNYLYITFYKGPYNEEFYSSVKMEVSVLPNNINGYYPSPLDYNYGKIPVGQNVFSSYIISRVNKIFNYCRLEFSSNSENIDFSLNKDKNSDKFKSDMKYDSIKTEGGKTIVIVQFPDENTMELYLSVFAKGDHTITDDKLSNFVFRFGLYKDNTQLPNFSLSSQNVNYTYENEQLTLIVPEFIGIFDVYDFHYYIKLYPEINCIKGEKLDGISMTESETELIEYHHEITMGDSKTYVIKNVKKERVWNVVVLVELVDVERNEYFSFNMIHNPTNYREEKGGEDDDENGSGTSKVLIIVVVAVACILVIGGIIFLLIYCKMKKTNQDLMKQINEIDSNKEEKQTTLVE